MRRRRRVASLERGAAGDQGRRGRARERAALCRPERVPGQEAFIRAWVRRASARPARRDPTLGASMKYCKRCVYPFVAVNLNVDDDGICSACRTFEQFEELAPEFWDARRQKFE